MSAELRSPHPDLEDLAAFVDGNLDAASRAEVERHLADCPRCFEVFSETVRFQVEDSASPGEVVRGRFGLPKAPIWILAAAVVAVAIGSGLWQWRSMRDPQGVERLVERLPETGAMASAFAGDWVSTGWSVTRGKEVVLTGRDQAAFRLGVRTVSLRAALETRDRAAAGQVTEELRGYAESLDEIGRLLAFDQIQGYLEDGTGDFAAGLEMAREVDRWPVPPDVELLVELGRWAEVARIASGLQDAEFFGGRAWRRGLDGLSSVALSSAGTAAARELHSLSKTEHQARAELLRQLFSELGG